MIHLGDITKIHGDQIEPVDCITFGSPCQDLSMAGLRAGLEGKNSGLFTEAIRVIVEMRVATAEKISDPCWKNLPAQHNQTFQFLALRGGAMVQGRGNHRKWLVSGVAAS